MEIMENQKIEIHLILHSLEEAREELRKSLKRRKDIALAENDTQYQEIDSTELFAYGNTSEFDATGQQTRREDIRGEQDCSHAIRNIESNKNYKSLIEWKRY